MEIEDERDAGEPERQPGEDEPIGQGRDLDDRVPVTPVRPGEGNEDPPEELEILGEVRAEAGSLVALDVEAMDVRSADDDERRSAGRPEREDVDDPTGSGQRLGLASEAGILLEIAVGDEGDPAPAISRRAGDRIPARAGQA